MSLTRSLDDGLFPRKRGIVAFVLNNPSIADDEIDDPTVKRGWQFTESWGYGHMIFVNTNPYRATIPRDALRPPEHIMQTNDQWLRYVMAHCELVVCAWGDKANPILAQRAIKVMHSLGPLHALKVTKLGNPHHPLYLPGDLQPQIWTPPCLH